MSGGDMSPRRAIAAALTRMHDLPSGSRAASLSDWSMSYFAALVVPALSHAIRSGRPPPVAIDEVSREIDGQGRVVAFRSYGVASIETESSDLFHPLVVGHLDPMIQACASLLSRRVLWSNAAVMIDHALALPRSAVTPHAEIEEQADALLDGRRYPRLARPYRAEEPRARTICCLRYRLPGSGACPGICPRRAKPV